MKKLLGLAVLFFLFTCVNAQTNDSSRESWYTYWGIGGSSFTYPSDAQYFFDELEKLDGVERTKLSLDMLGFYWHLKPNTIAGVLINTASDRFTIDSEWIQSNYYIMGPSIIHFPGINFGKGFFLRSDIGLARLVVQNSEGDSEASDLGFGILAGGGWSFDLGGTRILLNANYSYRNIEGDAIKILGFSVGSLF